MKNRNPNKGNVINLSDLTTVKKRECIQIMHSRFFYDDIIPPLYISRYT